MISLRGGVAGTAVGHVGALAVGARGNRGRKRVTGRHSLERLVPIHLGGGDRVF